MEWDSVSKRKNEEKEDKNEGSKQGARGGEEK